MKLNYRLDTAHSTSRLGGRPDSFPPDSRRRPRTDLVDNGRQANVPRHGAREFIIFFLVCREKSIMILPQVHLRKPCYDFYFL